MLSVVTSRLPVRSYTQTMRSPQDGWQKHVFGAWAWLSAGLALGKRHRLREIS